jgi:hypothetical protein
MTPRWGIALAIDNRIVGTPGRKERRMADKNVDSVAELQEVGQS